jgi:hypothetical protein
MYMYSFIQPKNRPKVPMFISQQPISSMGFKMKSSPNNKFNSMVDKVSKGVTKCGSCGN